MEDIEELYFNNGQEWRDWLLINHAVAEEVWLVHYKKRANKVGISYQEALEEALCFGWIDGKMKRIDDEKHRIRYSPRKKRSIWSKINKEKVEKLIELGRMTEAGFARIDEAKQNGRWDQAYTNRKTEELPLDLRYALMKDQEALNNFQRFANSYRNTYIGWINDAKSEETRKRRIEEVVKRSSLNKKPGVQ